MPTLRRETEDAGRDLRCFWQIFICFFLASGIYMSWVYHLADLVAVPAADALTLVAGYLLQAAGLGLFALAERKGGVSHAARAAGAALMMLCAVPALRSGYAAGTLVFGLLANLMMGWVAGAYLGELVLVSENRRGAVFGGGYGAAVVVLWAVSRIGGGMLLRTGYALPLYTAAAAIGAFLLRPSGRTPETGRDAAAPEGRDPAILGALTVFFFSLVKNIGFDFSAGDLLQGVDLELSRVVYAVGLLTAGLISDRSRKYGAVCTLAALITPFIMIALRGEPLSVTVFWALDYFFYGFFSVFRVLLFVDRANTAPWTAGFGLLFGRIGDAAGTALNRAFAGETAPMVLTAAALFVVTVFLFFRLYQNADRPDPTRERSEREIFERFSARYALSPRERAVMRLVIEERSNAEIAQALYVSERTVKFHVHNILQKAGCRNRAGLMADYRAQAGEEISAGDGKR